MGLICLQGGAEFTAPCEPMDRWLLARAPDGPVAIAPLACAPGKEYRAAGRHGYDYYSALGATDVLLAPEPGVAIGGTVRSIVDARTVVIPGGSPARVRAVVMGTAIGAALRAHLAQGGMVIGASAGAMVLAGWMVLPEVGSDIRSGLAFVPDVLVLPHFSDPTTMSLLEVSRRRLGEWVTILGIPEQSGVVYTHGRLLALGVSDSWSFSNDGSRTLLSRAASSMDDRQ